MHWGSQRSFPASDCDSKTTTALGSQTSQTPALSASPHRQLSNIFLSSSFFLWTHSASFLQCGAFLTIWKHAVPASSSIHQIFGASAFFGFLIVQPKRKQRKGKSQWNSHHSLKRADPALSLPFWEVLGLIRERMALGHAEIKPQC